MYNLSLKCHTIFSKSHKCAQNALFDDQEENFIAFSARFIKQKCNFFGWINHEKSNESMDKFH